MNEINEILLKKELKKWIKIVGGNFDPLNHCRKVIYIFLSQAMTLSPMSATEITPATKQKAKTSQV